LVLLSCIQHNQADPNDVQLMFNEGHGKETERDFVGAEKMNNGFWSPWIYGLCNKHTGKQRNTRICYGKCRGKAVKWVDCKGSDKCGEHNYPCEDCGKDDCMDSDNKCKWFDENENAIWSPQGPQGFCKSNCVCNGLWDNGGRGGNCSAGGEGMKWCYVNKNSCRDAKPFVDNMQDVPFFSYFPCKGSDKCGKHNYPCEDCGKEDCMDSDNKCKWFDKNENAIWSPQGPQGFCKPKDPLDDYWDFDIKMTGAKENTPVDNEHVFDDGYVYDDDYWDFDIEIGKKRKKRV